MGDFHQYAQITTLHNLTDRSIEDLERELYSFSSIRPMSLVLPSLYSELQGPALNDIIEELAGVPYLGEIIIGLDQASEKEFKHAKKFFGRLPQHHRILWNDGPRLKALHDELMEKGLAPEEAGKGRNLWYCFGYALASGRGEVVGLHDCDILTYDRGMLARLMYPVANPNFNYVFTKGYYPRVTEETINGRVFRLLVTPLLNALLQIYSDNDYLHYLNGFRYALAGEFAMHIDVLPDLRIPSDWGIEIGILSEVRRNYSNRVISQVDISDSYDHKHQDVSDEDKSKGLSKMSIDIAKSVFRKMATDGIVFSPERFRTLKATYYRMALDMIEMYRNDAEMNGLSYDVDREERTAELFASNIMEAGQAFLDNPDQSPFTPRWNRVAYAVPDILDRMHEAVELDNAD